MGHGIVRMFNALYLLGFTMLSPHVRNVGVGSSNLLFSTISAVVAAVLFVLFIVTFLPLVETVCSISHFMSRRNRYHA